MGSFSSIDIYSYQFARSYIKECITFAKKTNPRYSMRAFCKKVHISSSTMTEYLNEKNALSFENSLKIIKALNLIKSEADYFLLISNHERVKNADGKQYFLELIKQIGTCHWPNSRLEVESVINQLELDTEYRYVIQNTGRFRVLVFYKDPETKKRSPHFADRFFCSDSEIASTGYFFRQENGKYNSYLRKGFLKDRKLEFIANSNTDLDVCFDEEGFPEIKDFTLSVIGSEFLVRGDLKFSYSSVELRGRMFHPSELHNIIEEHYQNYIRLN